LSDPKENERQRQERADLVNAFTRTAWQPSSQPKVGPRVLTGGAALVLVAGAAFGFGAMVSYHHKQAASEHARQLALAAQNGRTTPSLQAPASPTASLSPTPSPTRRPVRSVRPTKRPMPDVSGRKAPARGAYRPIQAESFARRSKHLSTGNSNDTGGGRNIASAANGDWALYKRIDFRSTAATQFYARVASDKTDGYGRVDVRLDNPKSAPIATLYNINTRGWQNWSTVSAGANGLSGVHDVYLTFKSGQLWDFININWFRFGH
jgi:hypothetical protein